MPRKVRMHLGGDGGDGPGDGFAPASVTKQEFGRRVYQLMKKKGWIQSELARRAELPRDSISVYIRGKSLPTEQSLAKLAKALGVDPVELLPNHVESAIDADNPAFEIKVSPTRPDLAWLRINQFVTTKTALEIGKLLEADDAVNRARNGTKA